MKITGKKILIVVIVVAVICSIILFVRQGSNNFNILIIGDSISAGTGASSSDTKWHNMLKKYIGTEYRVRVNVDNLSLGGNTSYAGYVSAMRNDSDRQYDLIIVCYGENDSEEDFWLYYEILLRAIRTKYPDAKLVTILESSQREYTYKIGTIMELSSYYGASVADTIAAFDDSGFEYDELTDDGCHPNDLGHQIYFDTLKNTIENTHWQLDEQNDYDNLTPINNDAVKYDEFAFYDTSQLDRLSDLEYQLALEDEWSTVGINYDTVQGRQLIQVSTEDESYDREIVWEYGYVQEFIEQIENDRQISGAITIKFSSKEQADDFRGIALSR